MANWHLDELENALAHRGWQIVARLPGDDYRVSATWQIERGNDARSVLIDFDGLDDLKTLPIERSYACRQRGHRNSLYFGRKSAHWTNELARFVIALESADPAKSK
jgi:hypothetical protein